MPYAESGSKSVRIRHPSVQALLAANPNERNAKQVIRRLAQAKIAFAKTHNWQGPPFDPKSLASLFGIRCREVDHDIGSDGRLILYPDGSPWIEYRSNRLVERQRFTILHEFAHTFFPDYCDYLPSRHTPNKRLKDPEQEVETLCDVAAAEMLLPEQEFRTDVVRIADFCCEAIHELAARYLASFDATTHRVIDLAQDLACAALFLTDQRGEHTGRGPLWVSYCLRSTAFKGYFQPGFMPPQSSVAITCYANGNQFSCRATETWWINRLPRTWLVQAAKLPSIPENPAYPKVVVILLPGRFRGR